MRDYQGAKPAFQPAVRDPLRGPTEFVAACRGGQPSSADFMHAGPISDAFNLAAAALRAGKRLEYDAASMKITNVPDANKYLYREYQGLGNFVNRPAAAPFCAYRAACAVSLLRVLCLRPNGK
jgi:hypothetical protein